MAVVLAFVQELCQRLQATIAASDQLPLCVDKELWRLLKAFLAIQVTTLEAAEEKQSKSKAVRAWLGELKEVAYDADDLLDCLVLQAQEPEVKSNDTELVDQRRCLIFNCDQEHPATQTELMIKYIRRRVQKLMRKKPLCLTLHLPLSSNRVSHEVEEIEAGTTNPGVFGRDEDKEKLVKLLISDESSQVDVSLIAIVGREGVGKTTLARMIYDDKEVTSYFFFKVWVTATEIFDGESLSESISLSSAVMGGLQSPSREEDFDAELSARRFLLIVDDVRNENIGWETVWEKLQVVHSGGKILITTEKERFVNKTRLPSTIYHLKCLSHGDCWSLFRQCSYLDSATSNQNTARLEEVGMKIAAKLDGLPLAARLLGSLLCSNDKLSDWKMILNAEVWKSKPEELYGISAAVWLSYQHLPPHIKQCFSHCSLFTRGDKFDKDKLVQMWMAQGLIQPQPGIRMEDTGNEYFVYLVQRSLFQSSGTEYIMHGLVHSIAVAITVDESLRLSVTDGSFCGRHGKVRVRHLSLQSDNLEMSEIFDSGMLDALRTLFFYQRISSSFEYDALLVKLKCIRVMCLSDRGLTNLPKSIENLKQLRYLDISETDISIVPDELCSLYNLQTLKMSKSFSMEPLSKCMSNLVNLRHLEGNSYRISRIHQLGKLKFLQELEEFTVMGEDGHRIEELKNMKQLRGKVCISQLENVHTEEEAMQAELNGKEHIKKLELKWSWDYTWDGSPIEHHLATLEGLRPHTNLKDLIIRHNFGAKVPTWLEDGSLTSLETLEINFCQKWDLSLLGQLKSLKTLRLIGFSWLQHVSLRNDGDDDDQLFPCLRTLDISIGLEGCSSFIQVPLTLEEMQLAHVRLPTLPRLHQSRSSTSSSSLASLCISFCKRLTTLQVGLLAHQSQYQLQALHNLVIKNCAELVYLPDHGFSALVSLKTLHIEDCPKLRHRPVENGSATLPSSLIDFKVIRCAALTNDSFFISIGELHSLSSMVIKGAPAVDENRPPEHPVFTSLHWGLRQHLKSLKELQIMNCEWLTMLGLQALVSLKSLKIAGCPKLAACSLPSDKCPMLLEYLEIKDSSLQILNSELLQSLINLQELKIVECGKLVNFPNEMEEGLHWLVSLKRLFIHQCYGLRSLPCELATIPSLEEVCISGCDSIQYMPEKGLPASVFMLIINDCHYLKQRCSKDGEDWPKISHVFYIEIDYIQIDDQNVTEEMLSETASSSLAH